MPYPRFLAFNTVAILIWAILSATVGYLFGEYWDELLTAARSAGFALLIIVVLAIAWYAYRSRRLAKK